MKLIQFHMYLSKLQNVFVWIAKCICKNFKMYFNQRGSALPIIGAPLWGVHSKHIIRAIELWLTRDPACNSDNSRHYLRADLRINSDYSHSMGFDAILSTAACSNKLIPSN